MNKEVSVIWCNAVDFDEAAREALRRGVGDAGRVVFADEEDGERALSTADVAFGQPDAETVSRAENLRWVHLTSAGYTAYDREDLRAAFRARGGALTNSSDVYQEPCAQHLLTMMLALARQLPRSLDEQRGGREWSGPRIRDECVLLAGQTVLLVGYGAIARRLAELLGPLRLNLIGVRRRVAGDERIPVVTTEQIGEHLPAADHVVDILPANAETARFVDAAKFARMKRGAIFYNIGRGATVDQEALLGALRAGRLAAAYLDVTDPEPLPADHPLWDEPNCFITPHTAGGHRDEKERLTRHFLENLRRYTSGAELLDRVY